jgi:arylsulfatase A-like enzyme
MAGKWYAHEESIRVPFIVYDPRLPESKRGQKLDQMALNIDVAPTLLSLAGVSIPEEMQGRDVTPLFNGNAPGNWRNEFFYEHTIDIKTIPKSLAVVGERYKYIRYTELESGLEEFYDLASDPMEKNNLINEPEYAGLIEQHREKLEQMGAAVK